MAQDNNDHDLFYFMQQVSAEIASEYERIRRSASEDPGTAGDQGEENWAAILRDWLPRTYEVVTKGRIINEHGQTSRQVDVLVLEDFYPRKLLDKKRYLACGVAAAFECKTTVRPEHITEAVKTGVAIKRLLPERHGTPYRELHAPILYGILAHSHDWKSPHSRPADNVSKHLIGAERRYVAHPREHMDLLCIADLGTWSTLKTSFIHPDTLKIIAEDNANGPDPRSNLPDPSQDPRYAKGVTQTSYVQFPTNQEPQNHTPIGSLIALLSAKLAWTNPALRELASYYEAISMMGSGFGFTRWWPSVEVYSANLLAELHAGMRNPLTMAEPFNRETMFF
ncbi:DUF6602 domain-containing protein [Candidatus Palauibacter sp.]|uniref:DUF6602 domain-containing protein n=1 Tax=Candidatus Palauibacter sp. TaxID=3101350 RepID=UPI003B024B67